MKQKRWTKEEINFLRENYNKKFVEDIAKDLDRTISAIRHKIKHKVNSKQKYTKLTAKQIRFIKSKMNIYPPIYFSELFNVNIKALAGVISNIKNNKFWTFEQDRFLIENKDKMTSDGLGNHLNKSRVAIVGRLRQLQLKKKNFGVNTRFKRGESHPLPLKRISFDKLNELYNKQKLTITEICKKLNVSYSVIKRNLIEQNIKMNEGGFYTKGKPKPCMKDRMRGEKNPNYGGKLWTNKDYKEKRIKIMKKLWQNKDYKDKQVKLMRESMNIKPNKPEKKLIELFNKYNLPYRYVGDWSFVIEGKNPDFINCNGQKKIIELFGDYWHSDKCKYKKEEYINPEKRKVIFAKYGYKTLIIWENELKDVSKIMDKIRGFENE